MVPREIFIPRDPSPMLYRWQQDNDDYDDDDDCSFDSNVFDSNDDDWNDNNDNNKNANRWGLATQQEQARSQVDPPRVLVRRGDPMPSISPPRLPKRTTDEHVSFDDSVLLKPVRFVTKTESVDENKSAFSFKNKTIKKQQKVQMEHDMAVPLRELILPLPKQEDTDRTTLATSSSTTKNNTVTLVFVIRRTGCGMCRHHARQLSALANDMDGVCMIGVIKPEAVPHSRLLEFYTDYFNFPLYQDDDWQLYNSAALQNRKLSIWRLLSRAPGLESKYGTWGVQNHPFGGDLFTNGGLLILDKTGRLRYVYHERYGDEMDIEAIAWAVNQARRPLARDETPKKPARPLSCQQQEQVKGVHRPPSKPVRSASSSALLPMQAEQQQTLCSDKVSCSLDKGGSDHTSAASTQAMSLSTGQDDSSYYTNPAILPA